MNGSGSRFLGFHIPAHIVSPGPMTVLDYNATGHELAMPNLHNYIKALPSNEASHMIVYDSKAG